MFFNFWLLLLKMYIFEVVTFLSCLVVIQSTQFFSGNTYLLDSCFWSSIFPHNYQNAYDHQTFQGGDMLQGALTHIYASLPAEDVSIPHQARCWLSVRGSQTWSFLWSSDQHEVTWLFENLHKSINSRCPSMIHFRATAFYYLFKWFVFIPKRNIFK